VGTHSNTFPLHTIGAQGDLKRLPNLIHLLLDMFNGISMLSK